jgi:hypothetical protein
VARSEADDLYEGELKVIGVYDRSWYLTECIKTVATSTFSLGLILLKRVKFSDTSTRNLQIDGDDVDWNYISQWCRIDSSVLVPLIWAHMMTQLTETPLTRMERFNGTASIQL